MFENEPIALHGTISTGTTTVYVSRCGDTGKADFVKKEGRTRYHRLSNSNSGVWLDILGLISSLERPRSSSVSQEIYLHYSDILSAKNVRFAMHGVKG